MGEEMNKLENRISRLEGSEKYIAIIILMILICLVIMMMIC